MKSYPDRLKDLPKEQLVELIKRQKQDIEIFKRDLSYMEAALASKQGE